MKTAQAPSRDRMITENHQVCFNTPAFLGDADQNGRWRTPPFKHLLREWWRVAWAEADHFTRDYRAMREEEGLFFGAAADGTGSRSRVRLRLDRWGKGKEKRWGDDPKTRHPEVGREGALVGSHLYLGYGPLTYDKKIKGTKLKANAAIQAGEEAMLKLAFPESEAVLLERALALLSQYGALGGRSRNGWGSLELLPSPVGRGAAGEGKPPLREWRDCLDREWAHAIGKDENGALIWRTGLFGDWRQLMRELAEIKIGLRTQFSFPNEKPPHSCIEDRHWLSYPVTNHPTKAWERNARLPNTLRFKVRRDDHGKLYGVIFHMPCKPPAQFQHDTSKLEMVWRKVHRFLDANLERNPQ